MPCLGSRGWYRRSPWVTTTSAAWAASSVSGLGNSFKGSSQRSLSTATADGLSSPAGPDPAKRTIDAAWGLVVEQHPGGQDGTERTLSDIERRAFTGSPVPLEFHVTMGASDRWFVRTAERDALRQVMADVGSGQGAVLVPRGEPRIGKTELLQYLIREASGFRLARAVGVESGMELPFAGLHELCAPMVGRIGLLGQPPPAPPLCRSRARLRR